MTPTPNPTPLAEHNVIKDAQGLATSKDSCLGKVTAALLRAIEGLEGIKSKCTATDDPSTAFLYEALAPVFTEISECVDADLADIRCILDGEVQQDDKP